MFLIKKRPKYPFVDWDVMTLNGNVKINVCIISKDKDGFLNNCLESIFNHVKYPNYNVHVIAKSHGGDLTELADKTNKEFIKKIHVYEKYERGNCDGDFILFLDDNVLFTYDAITEMTKYACISNIGCVSHRLIWYDNKQINNAQNTKIDEITVSCLLIRKKLADKINKIDFEFGLKINKLGYTNLCIRNRSLLYARNKFLYRKNVEKNNTISKSIKDISNLDLHIKPKLISPNGPFNYSYVVCATKLDRLQKLQYTLKSKKRFNFVYLNNNVFNMPSSESLNKLTDATTGKYIFYSHQDVVSESSDFLLEFEQNISPIKKFGLIGIAGMKPIVFDFYWLKDCKNKRTGADFSIGKYPFNLMEVQTLDEFLMIADRDNELKFGEYLDHFHFYGADICLTAKSKKLKNYVAKLSFKHCSNGSDNLKDGGYKHYVEQSKKFYEHWKEKFPRIATTTAMFEEKEIYFAIGELYGHSPIKIAIEPETQKIKCLLDDKQELLKPLQNILGNITDPELPWLDKTNVNDTLTDDQKYWKDNGLIVKSNLLPNGVIDNYKKEWVRDNRQNSDNPDGYQSPCPYMQIPSLLELATCDPIQNMLKSLIGEPMGVHLALTGWKSTERNWHQDSYLNPSHVKDWYVAVWIALNDIHEDSGPFEFIRGSHILPPIEQNKIITEFELDKNDAAWPKKSEELLTPLLNGLIDKAELNIEKFVPKKGDVLFWHARLLHRGSEPKNADLWREAVILHYSGVNHRGDMPDAKQYKQKGWYFPIANPKLLPTRSDG